MIKTKTILLTSLIVMALVVVTSSQLVLALTLDELKKMTNEQRLQLLKQAHGRQIIVDNTSGVTNTTFK